MRTDDQAADQLRARYAAAAPTITVDPTEIVRRGHRRRRTTRLVGAAGVLVLVTALGVGLRGLIPDSAPPAPADPPPPASGPVRLWLSATEVPPGAELAAAIVSSDPGEPDTFGILATVERWDGQEWDRHGEIAMCPVDWQCSNEVVDRVDAVEDIGLSAAPGQPGPLVRLSTEGLDPGWYRVSHEGYAGTVAAGVVHVVAGAPAPAPLPPLGQSAFTVTPALVPTTGGVVSMYPVIPSDGDGGLTAEDVAMATADLVPEAAVERWTGSAWEPVDVGPLLASTVADDPTTTTYVPRLPEGAYRLVRESTAGGLPHTGSFWVVDDTLAGHVEPPPEGGQTDGDAGEDGTGTEDPAGPCLGRDPVTCALAQWLTELVDGAGYETSGGDHDIMAATNSIPLDDVNHVWLRLIATSRDGEMADDAGWTDEATLETPAGPVTVRSRTVDDESTLSMLTCGGFTLTASVTGGHDEREVLENLAGGLTSCPADEDALVASWADFIAGRTG